MAIMRNRLSRTPFVCPVCSEELPANAVSCPECGACERSGWSDQTIYDGLDFEEDAQKNAPSGFWWRIVAGLILLALLALFIGRLRWG